MIHLILPPFPKTPHLPWNPNPGQEDVIANNTDALNDPQCHLCIEEKVDGSSVGITFFEQHPIVRNRDHILNKGFLRKKQDTPAKMQFRPIWNWIYQNIDKFKTLETYSVYGQWMLAQHGMFYNQLPDWLIAHDLFDHAAKQWVSPEIARPLLQKAGFHVPPCYYQSFGNAPFTPKDYIKMTQTPSAFASDLSEGIYLKLSKQRQIVHRFKMVRQDFQQGKLWNNKHLTKNKLK